MSPITIVARKVRAGWIGLRQCHNVSWLQLPGQVTDVSARYRVISLMCQAVRRDSLPRRHLIGRDSRAWAAAGGGAVARKAFSH